MCGVVGAGNRREHCEKFVIRVQIQHYVVRNKREGNRGCSGGSSYNRVWGSWRERASFC